MDRNNQQAAPTLEQVKRILQPILTTVKGDISSAELERDYKHFENQPLPYRQLGFATVDELIKNIPDVASWSYVNGSLRVRPTLKNERTRHIQELVRGQKRSGSRRSSAGRGGGRGGFGAGTSRPQFNPRMAGGSTNSNQQRNAPNGMQYYRPPALRMEPTQSGNQVIRQPTLPGTIRPSAAAAQASTAPRSMKPLPSKPLSLPLNNTRSNRDKLRRLVEVRQLAREIYSSNKLKNGKYIGCVEIDRKKISCYPDEFDTEEKAFEEAAKLALEELDEKFKGKDATRQLPVTSDLRMMTRRILELVQKKPSGCWSEAFPQQYEDEYGESLPDEWVIMVQNQVKELEFTPVGDYFTICFKKSVKGEPQSQFQPPPLAKARPIVEESISEVFEKPEQKPLIVSPSCAKLEVGSFMKVLVQVILKGAECQVGVRKVDDALHAQWDAMMTEMEMFYNDNQSKMKPIQRMDEGKLYAGFADSIWYRVQLIDYGDIKDTANVLLIDYGDVDSLPFSAIYQLDSRFSSAPPQGMICNLYGLTPFAAQQSAYDSALKMVDSVYDAYVVSSEPLTVVLYDPTDGSDLNEWILSQVYENLLPEPLSRSGGSLDKALVTVSYVSSTCDVYLRRCTQQTALVDALVSLAALRVSSGILPPAKTLSPDGVYLGRNDLHGWCRMTPLSATPAVDGNVPVMLMDHGDVDFVSIESLRLLTTFSTVLTKLPGQAVRVTLARVPPTSNKTFTPQAAKKLREMAPPDSQLLLRVLETSRSGLPVVELFERLASGKVAMLNASLELDENLYKSSDDRQKISPEEPLIKQLENHELVDLRQDLESMQVSGNRKSSVSSGVGSHSSGSTPSPTPQHVVVSKAQLPLIKSNFDVKVFNVVDPTNFYIHPLKTLPDLITLSRQLKDSEHPAIDPDAVVLSGFYIYWCPELLEYRRVQVMRKCGKFVEVSFIDHGGIQITPCNNLLHLSPEFKELPAQAMRARLYGVKPVDGDWSLQNVLFFKKFLEKVSTFTSTVMDVLPDQTLVLQLFDLTGRNEVSVAQYLVDNFHASQALP